MGQDGIPMAVIVAAAITVMGAALLVGMLFLATIPALAE